MRGEFLDLSGARLYYYAAGTRGAGNPVVFLHGFPTSGHLWSDVVPLMPRGHRIVVLDLLGFGRSDRPHDRDVGIHAHAARVVELLDELRIERACIVGHGIGGGIAQSLGVRHSSRVSHLCLINSVGFDAWPSRPASLARVSLPIARLLPPDVIVRLLRRHVLRGYADPARAAHSMDLYLRPFSGPDGRDALVAHVRALVNDETVALGASLRSISVPTAVVWGSTDSVVSAGVGRRLSDAIPGATLELVGGARHFTPEEAPRQVAEAVGRLLLR